MTLYPEVALAINSSGKYTFEVDGVEKNISKATYNINLAGREKNLYFNSTSALEIDLEEEKLSLPNTWLCVYNKPYKLELFNLSLGIGQLVEPNLNLYGVKFETIKKSETKINKAMFFTGKSIDSTSIMGTKISTDYGPNTFLSLFLLNKDSDTTIGANFSKPIYKLLLLQGECYLDSSNKWGLLLKNSINNKYNTLQSEYSMVDSESSFKLLNKYKTKRLNTEIEYSTEKQNILYRLKCNFETKKFSTGGYISKRKNNEVLYSLAKDSFSYNGYIKYNWKLLEKISPSITYSHSYSDTYQKNILDSIYLGTNYYDTISQLSMSTQIGYEMEKEQSPTSIKKELTFNRGIGLRYTYHGFKPWVNFKFSTKDEEEKIHSQEKLNSLSYGISKNITKIFFLSYSCYQTEDKSERLKKKTINNQITLDYRFPKKIPLILNSKISWINKDKPTSYITIGYKKRDEKDIFTKYQNEEIKYIRERPIKFGTKTTNMVSLSKEFPKQENLLHLGRVIIVVFKDEDFDGNFSREKDIPLKETKVTLGKIELLTDESGKASFIDIPPGTYTFSLDASEMPIGIACPTKVNQILKIKEGEDIYLNFPFVYGGRISGGVFIDKNRNGAWDEGEKGAEDILIYIEDTIKYTSLTGKYEFRNVIPNIVKIKIDKESLPENFEVTTKDNFEIKLLPKQEIKNINFGIAEIEPEIEFE